MKVQQYEILERITELEGELTVDGNSARVKMIEQGSLINMAVSNGLALKEVAAKCGLTLSNARVRSSVASKLATEVGRDCQVLLDSYEQVYVSFDALNSVLNDDDPVQLLSTLFFDAGAAGKSRITRDRVRQGRGKAPGTVGTTDATISRMFSDPEYAAEMFAKLSETEAGRLMLLQYFSVLQKQNSARLGGKGKVADDILSAIYKDRRSTVLLAETLLGQTPLAEEYRAGLTAHVADQRRRYELIEAQLNGESVDDELAALLEAGDR